MSLPLFALAALIIGSVGEAVRRLHFLLRAVGFGNIPNDESENATYGPGTAEAVKQLQSQLNLTPPRPGEIDADTAEAVNRSLFANGRFYHVYGRVADQNGQPVVGVTVRVTDADNLGGAFCAETTTGADGEYRAYYDPTYYTGPWHVITRKEFVEPIVAVIENGVELGSSPRSAPERELRVDLRVERPVVPEGTGLRVRGTVVDDRGGRLEDVRVEVFDRDIGDIQEWEPLGHYTTGPLGDFEIKYATEKFETGDAARPLPATADLIFKLSKDGAEVATFDIVRLPVGRDGPITVEFTVPEEEKILGIVARPDELVRIVAHGIKVPRGQSEYERLIEELKPLTSRRALAEFDEAGTRDVTFAAREIGEPVALVADLVWAHQMTAAGFSDSPAEALYGLARQLGTRDARGLAARSVGELAAGLGDSIAALTIPELADDLTRGVTTIHDAAVRLALDAAPTGASGSLGSVLAGVLPEPSDREVLLAKATNHTGTGKEFWDAYRAENPEVPVDAVQYTIQLGALTSNNAPLVAALKAAAPEAKSLRTLALTLDRTKVEELVTASGGVPLRGGADEPAAAAQANYVREINGLLEAAHPTAVVARLARAWSQTDPEAVTTTAAGMLSTAVLKTDFDITRGDIDDLIAAHGDVLFEGVNDPDQRTAAADSVKPVHRLFKVSSDPAILERLVLKRINGTLPLRGAIDIARYGKDAFIANFPDATAEEMHMLSYGARR